MKPCKSLVINSITMTLASQGEAIMELRGLSENQILSGGYVLPTER
jgi:hypothetical protein